jgi:hypothetical protein
LPFMGQSASGAKSLVGLTSLLLLVDCDGETGGRVQEAPEAVHLIGALSP